MGREMAAERVRIRKDLQGLKPSDIVEFDRGQYSHYGIYEGEEMVIHKADILRFFSSLRKSATVIASNIWEVAGDSPVYRHNYMDSKMKPKSPEEVVKRARSKLGDCQYSLVSSNCEHFATWCRYDVERSSQVENFAIYVGAGALLVAVAGLAYFARTEAGKAAFAAAGKMVATAGKAVVSTAVSAGKAVVSTAVSAGKAVVSTAVSAGKAVVSTAVSAGKAVVSTAVSAGKAVVSTAVSAGKAVVSTAVSAGKAALSAAKSSVVSVGKSCLEWWKQSNVSLPSLQSVTRFWISD